MSGVELRACCRAPDAPACWAVRVGAPVREHYGPLIETVHVTETNVTARTAYHEAGHAVAAIALPGFRLEYLRLSAQAEVGFGAPCATWRAHAAFSLAGPVAENWYQRHTYSTRDSDLEPYAERLVAGVAGFCDVCAALRQIRDAMPNATPAEHFATFRRIEGATLSLIRTPAIWRAIQELSAFAMSKGGAFGFEIEQICAKHFMPGSYRLVVVE